MPAALCAVAVSVPSWSKRFLTNGCPVDFESVAAVAASCEVDAVTGTTPKSKEGQQVLVHRPCSRCRLQAWPLPWQTGGWYWLGHLHSGLCLVLIQLVLL